ncbi:hypothetical protein QYE76_021338 [Lolium multiflorum]|uniref:DUF4283 domain-containing protein n=1 Tax=Lolium multiflorum TaxID=4521 RepID=A0AAD8R878_LOLMU|nr:hypothetical protein QYE76_021338 [Lolium multiflorum]
MEAELKDLVDEDWEWHVQKINDSDFAMFFPSKESLRMAIRGGGLTLPSSKLHIIVTNNAGDPAAAEQLVEVWVKLYDVPPPYRQAVRILLAARELGRPITVDESSLLSSSEPIRLLLGHKSSTSLPSFFTLFVNSQGFKVRVVPEAVPTSSGGAAPPPPQPRPADDKEEDPEESEGDGWDGRRGKHTQKNKGAVAAGASASAPPNRKTAGGSSLALDPTLPASALSQYGSNLAGKGDIFPVLAKIVHQVASAEKLAEESAGSGGSQSPPSPSISMDSTSLQEDDASPPHCPSLWKAQLLSEEDRAEAGIESPISWETDPEAMRARERRSKSNADRPSLRLSPTRKDIAVQLDFSDGLPEGKGSEEVMPLREGVVIAELAASVTRAPRSKSNPPVSARTSARGAGSSSIPIMEKAMQRARDKVPGTSSKSISDFAVLQSVSDDKLLAVAHDSCVLFPSASGNPAPLLSIIRAKELVQAELAMARDRIEEEQRKAKELKLLQEQEVGQPSSVSPTGGPVGEKSPVKQVQQVKSRKIQKKQPSLGKRVLTRQARGRKVVPQ